MSTIPKKFESLINDLALVSKLNAGQIEAVRKLLSGNDQRIERPERLAVIASESIDLPTAEAIIRLLFDLHNVVRRSEESAASLLAFQESQLLDLKQPEMTSEAISGIEVLRELADVAAVARTAKAIELSYDCDNLLQRSRILTDVRPLFSDDAQEIQGAVVAHTLRLRYDSAGTDHEISLALDSSDLRRLIEDCERALQKERTAQAKLCDVAKVPSMIEQE
jgi:hypothetical protein